MSEINWEQEFESQHGLGHGIRTMLLALIIARTENCECKELGILALAALLHDAGRVNDGHDPAHGKRGAEMVRRLLGNLRGSGAELAARLVEQHCEEDAEKMPGMLKWLKDADALERFRLGPNALNEKYLRTSAARWLVPLAKEWHGKEG